MARGPKEINVLVATKETHMNCVKLNHERVVKTTAKKTLESSKRI